MAAQMLDELLRAAAERTPLAPAVSAADGELSYRELHELASRIGAGLRELGVRPGDRVGLLGGKTTATVAGVHGVLYSGGGYIPLDPTAPPARWARLIADCGVHVVAGEAGLLRRLDEVTPGLRAVVLNGAAYRSGMIAIPDEGCAPAPADPERLAYILYTSGSTGEPKGVAFSHRGCLSFVHWAVREFEVRSADVVSNHAPFHFDMSVLDLNAAASAGARVSLVPAHLAMFPLELAEWIASSGITCWYSVPFPLARMAELGEAVRPLLSGLRLIMFAGEPFPSRQLAALVDLTPGARHMNLYGPTETDVCTYHQVPRPVPDPLPIGFPVPGNVCVLRDGDREITEPGTRGELYVSGPTLAEGYWNRPDLTARQFVPTQHGRAYRTGDLCMLDRHGALIFLGRMDNQVKVRGNRVELGEVERAAEMVPGVRAACAVVVRDRNDFTRLFLMVSADQMAPGVVRDACAAVLPTYAVPAEVVVSSILPRTASGKIDRQSVEKYFAERDVRRYD